MRALIGLLLLLLLIIGLGAAFIYSGAYNVSAREPHSRPVAWLFTKLMDNSIHAHAEAIEVPSLGDAAQTNTGLRHYQEMCVTCHGAPGFSRSEIGKGLNPTPPDLAHSVEHMGEAELFWVVSNGIKMTGMPAFGPTHSDDDIWAIVSVVRKFRNLDAEEYKRMLESAGIDAASHAHEGGSAEEHDHD